MVLFKDSSKDPKLPSKKEIKSLQDNNEMLLSQIKDLQKETQILSEKNNTEDGPGEKDLIIVQLQQEIIEMKREMSEISDEKVFMEKQLGY